MSDPTTQPRRLRKEDALLLVIDMQEKILRKCLDHKWIELNASKLIRACRGLDIPILVTEQYPRGLGPTSHAVAAALGSYRAVPKTCFSCLEEPSVAQAIEKEGRSQIIVCGIEAHICVYQTARAIVDSGRTPHVVGDAVTARGEFDLEVALRRMGDEGAVVTSTELVIYDLLGDAGNPDFKGLLPLLKE